MDIKKNGWVGAMSGASGGGGKVAGKKGKGIKNSVPAEKGKRILGGELKNNTKNPGAL